MARTYRELEEAGLVETRGRNGTFVTAAGQTARVRLQEAARAYALLVKDFNVPTEEELAIVHSAIETAR